MCGIAGILILHGADRPTRDIALSMVERIRHRGPDGNDTWSDENAGIGLAHQRLSIIDLSNNGSQPMISACGNFILTFNGEIYNFPSLREKLEGSGISFRGHSDTEVFLELCIKYGVTTACQRANGMFAFALWDRAKAELTLGRDRFGQKPLYYGTDAGRFFFASELKAFGAIDGYLPTICQTAKALYFQHGYIPSPLSIYKDVSKLMPGTILRVQKSTISNPNREVYWSALESAKVNQQCVLTGSRQENDKLLEDALMKSVKQSMISDVPIGCFLSGGIDSSLISAFMQAQSTQRVKTFSIGFEESEYDESGKASLVAARLGTEHSMMTVTARDAIDAIPLMPIVYDEPFADASQIPTYLLSKMTRAKVTVALSGDGGDELFGGYSRYVWASKIAQILAFPKLLRTATSLGLSSLPPSLYDQINQVMSLTGGQLGDKVHKVAKIINGRDLPDAYLRMTSIWDDASAITNECSTSPISQTFANMPSFDMRHKMMLADTLHYLPDDILVKVDRASMASGLETRIPFLDQNVFDVAWQLNIGEKMAPSGGKFILRRMLERMIGADLSKQSKMGFALPIDKWLRGELRDWAETLLEPQRLLDNQINPELVREIWNQHLSGTRNWQHRIWTVLMYQIWAETSLAQA